jgi:hypothetical protein
VQLYTSSGVYKQEMRGERMVPPLSSLKRVTLTPSLETPVPYDSVMAPFSVRRTRGNHDSNTWRHMVAMKHDAPHVFVPDMEQIGDRDTMMARTLKQVGAHMLHTYVDMTGLTDDMAGSNLMYTCRIAVRITPRYKAGSFSPWCAEKQHVASCGAFTQIIAREELRPGRWHDLTPSRDVLTDKTIEKLRARLVRAALEEKGVE